MAERLRPSDPILLERQRRFDGRYSEIIGELGKPELPPQRQYELKIQRTVVKYVLGKDIRTEEDYRKEINTLFNEIDSRPEMEKYFSETVRTGHRSDKGKLVEYSVPRSRAIIEDTMAGKFGQPDSLAG